MGRAGVKQNPETKAKYAKKDYLDENGRVPVGRPGLDIIAIGKDFVKWCTDNPEALTVPCFTTRIGIHSGIFRDWAAKNQEFNALLREGKEQIGLNRLRMTLSGGMDNGLYKQNMGNYDVDNNEYMRDERTFEAQLTKETASSVNDKVLESYGKFHKQLKSLRKSQPDDEPSLSKADSK